MAVQEPSSVHDKRFFMVDEREKKTFYNVHSLAAIAVLQWNTCHYTSNQYLHTLVLNDFKCVSSVLYLLLKCFKLVLYQSKMETIRFQESSGHNISSGVVEVYYNTTWGVICDESVWTEQDAEVTCRQFGLNGGSPEGAFSWKYFLLGCQTFSLGDIKCNGD